MERFAVTFRYQKCSVTVLPVEPNWGIWRLEHGEDCSPFELDVLGSRVRSALMIEEEPPYESEIQVTGPDLRGFIKNNTWPANLWWSNWDWSRPDEALHQGGAQAVGNSIDEAIVALIIAIFGNDDDD
jgi:hypothetical protein